MTRSVSVSHVADASPDAALDDLRERLGLPQDAPLRWDASTGALTGIPCAAEVDGSRIVLTAELPDRVIPFFGVVFDPMVVRHVRTSLERVLHDAPRRRPRWAPPVPLNLHQVRILATLSFVLALTGYGGALLTQTIDFVAQTFDASDTELGVVTAATRVGTLVALFGSALADRAGRRRVVLWATGTVAVATFVSGLVPNLVVMTVLQVFVRAGATVAGVVAIIAITEEAPEGGRAYTIAVTGVAGSLGFAIGSVLLPVADIGSQAWRALFFAGGLGLLFLPSLARLLTETVRYETLVARGAKMGRAREVVDRVYGGRFFVLLGVAFLLNAFFAPVSQFTNRYLGAERDFSGFDILVLRAITQTVTAIGATYVGGHVAESLGRKPVARVGVLLMAVTTAGFFLGAGPLLWIALAISTAAAGFASASLAAFNTELFPTEVRGTAGAGLLVASVAGAVVGLVGVGALSDTIGSVGQAVAVTAVGPALVGLLLLRLLPEARGKLLDAVSPPEV